MEAQPEWGAHASFMDALEREGFVMLGGPLDGTRDVLLVVRGDTADEVRSRLGEDPWVQMGLLRDTLVAPWTLRLGVVERARPRHRQARRENEMERNPVGWFEIYVQDMARAKRFYESVFQVTLERLDSPGIEMWAFPISRGGPGAAGALVKMPGVPSGGNSSLVYFGCADCATEAGRVAPAGGRVHKEKTSIGQWGFIAQAIDPDGNMFGLHSAA